jgi:predicted phosphoribosyltransferase
MTFTNRLDAGRQLGMALLAERPADPIVMGISRGGVPVAAEVAHVLRAPLEICVVRKVFSPGSPAFSIGAIAEAGGTYLDEAAIARLGLSPAVVNAAIALEAGEVDRLAELLRDEPPLSVVWRNVILVDDAVTSLDTLRAAARGVRAREPASITLAVPLADTALLQQLRDEFDRVVCLDTEDMLVAAGSRYREFWPVSENEVAAVLAGSRVEARAS